MVWVGRYMKKYPDHFKIPGGRPLLLLVALFYLLSLGVEVFVHMGWAPSYFDVQEINVL